MLEGGLVEDEDVGEGCDYEVEEGAGEPGIVSMIAEHGWGKERTT